MTQQGYAFLGLLLGAASTLFWSRQFASPPLAIANLIVTPLVAGLVMRTFGQQRRARGHSTTNLATFAGGLSFALGTALARFMWA